MKETIQDLKTRRSCRRYQDKQITDEELDQILEIGTYAPTAMNLQTPVMVVVQDRETLKTLSAMNAAVWGKSIDPFYGAPTAVIVLADRTKKNYVQDGSLVLGNLMNAAHALGVGSCWINRAKEMFDTEEGKAFLKKWGLEGDYAGVGICILGYCAEGGERPAAPRKPDYILRPER